MKFEKDPEDINYDDGVTKQDEKFAEALFNLLQELVDMGSSDEDKIEEDKE